MKFKLLFLMLVTLSVNSYAQKIKTTITSAEKLEELVKKEDPKKTIQTTIDSLSNWEKKNVVGFDLNEIAFMNWSAGGTSSISGLFKGNFTRVYTADYTKWVNELIVRYGINKQDGFALRKSDDEFRLNSTFGYRSDESSKWFTSAKFNFNTQFTNGYLYPDTNYAISKPFAPAYTFLGAGVDYYDKERQFDIYFSPITFKNTLVLDERLANKGAFGVKRATYDDEGNLISKGKQSKTEFGVLLTNYFKVEIWQNITMENRLSLYSDYINNFGNIDVDWQLQFDLIVNKYVTANIGAHILYDDDVKSTEEVNGEIVYGGPKLQLKQTLGIGLVYTFATKY